MKKKSITFSRTYFSLCRKKKCYRLEGSNIHVVGKRQGHEMLAQGTNFTVENGRKIDCKL